MRRTRRGKLRPVRKRGWNYPRAGYGPIRRWVPSWRIVLASVFLFLAMGVGAVGYLYVTIDIPQPGDFALARTTTVYYSDGKTKMGTFAQYEREPIKLSDLPDTVPHAVVASEDSSFYTNSGISPRGIARAVVNNLRGGHRQGASTITQQYVERYYLGTTRGYLGKLKEALLAIKIDQQQSKNEILENYLNTIYFGRGAYGIEMAAQKYFGIHAQQLNLSQSAMLSAIIPSPSGWDPAVNPEKAKERWTRVLNRMVGEGYISKQEAESASFPQTIPPGTLSAFSGTNGYLLAAVDSELRATKKFTADDLNQNGLKIVTTIDPKMQKASVDAVAGLPKDRPANNYVGLVSVDPRTGEIYAMYGGADYKARERNAVTQDRAQAGSTFKPFTLLAALDSGKSLSERLDSSTPKVFSGNKVQNFDGKDRGKIDLITATKYSVNTAYVQLNEDVGPDKTKKAAITAGIPENTPGLDSTLTNVLGSASPRPIDMAKAYSVFANQGVSTTPHIVRSVQNKNGETVYTAETEGKRVFESELMSQMNYALQSVTSSDGTGSTAGKLDRPVAGKTGTSSGPWSAWFIGYTPQMVTVVDMYQVGSKGEEEVLTPFGKYTYGIGGGSFPAEIWLRYMEVATDGMKVENFPKPKKRVTPTGDDETETPAKKPSQAPTTRGRPTSSSPGVSPTPTERTPSEPTRTPTPTPTRTPEPTTPPAVVPSASPPPEPSKDATQQTQ